MIYRKFMVFMPIVVFAIACTPTREGNTSAASVHERAVVIDTHSDFLDRSEIDGSGLNDDVPEAQTTIRKMQQGMVDAQFFAIFVPPAFEEYGFTRRTNELIDRFTSEVDTNSQHIEFVTDTGGIQRLANSGKIAALIGIEGGHSIENDLANISRFYDRGVRYMTLTWANSNDWAGSSGDDSRSSGLSSLGVQIVHEMNRLGMMVDISHSSDATFWDVMSTTRSPVIASHSSARGVANSERNLSDEMIIAMADNGGVIQVNFHPAHLDADFGQRRIALLEGAESQFEALNLQYGNNPIELDKKMFALEKTLERQLSPPNMSRIVDHIDHIVGLVGVDHAGLGSDFDGMGATPEDMEHIGKIANITEELLRRGYSIADVRKILGGNFLRVFSENETIAKESR